MLEFAGSWDDMLDRICLLRRQTPDDPYLPLVTMEVEPLNSGTHSKIHCSYFPSRDYWIFPRLDTVWPEDDMDDGIGNSPGKKAMIRKAEYHFNLRRNGRSLIDKTHIFVPWPVFWTWMNRHGGWWIYHIDHQFPGLFPNTHFTTDYVFNDSPLITDRWHEVHLSRPTCAGYENHNPALCSCAESIHSLPAVGRRWMKVRLINFPEDRFDHDLFWMAFFEWHRKTDVSCVAIASDVTSAWQNVWACQCGDIPNFPDGCWNARLRDMGFQQALRTPLPTPSVTERVCSALRSCTIL